MQLNFVILLDIIKMKIKNRSHFYQNFIDNSFFCLKFKFSIKIILYITNIFFTDIIVSSFNSFVYGFSAIIIASLLHLREATREILKGKAGKRKGRCMQSSKPSVKEATLQCRVDGILMTINQEEKTDAFTHSVSIHTTSCGALNSRIENGNLLNSSQEPLNV